MRHIIAECWGLPGVGKSHQVIEGFPNPVVLDTAYTNIGFRQLEVDPDPNERGETWPVVKKLYDWDADEADKHYEYITEFPTDFDWLSDEYSTVIIDNAADMKVLAAKHWCEETGKDWPQQAEWSSVYDKIDEMLRVLQRDYHVVVVAQMKDEYIDGDKSGDKKRDGFKRMDFKADWRFEIVINDDGERECIVRKNRFMDAAGGEYGSRGTDINQIDFEELMMLADIPEDEWNL